MSKAQYAQKKYYGQYYHTVAYYSNNWDQLSTCNLHIPSATKSKLGIRQLGFLQVQALASPKAIYFSRILDYLDVYPTSKIYFFKPAAALLQAMPGPTGTSGTSHLGPTGPSSLPISEDEYDTECTLREHCFRGERQ